MTGSFPGFSHAATEFLTGLAANNNREWFLKRKGVFDREVIQPAQEFVLSLGEKLLTLSPTVTVDPRANGVGSIFRIYRDVRFSKDKSPYKTHLGIFFWDGPLKKHENPGYYVHIEPPRLSLYTGLHTFDKPLLARFRGLMSDPATAAELAETVREVESAGPYAVGGKHYKRWPPGFNASHENAGFLLYNSLFCSVEGPLGEEFYTPGIIDYCFNHFKAMNPINVWIKKHL